MKQYLESLENVLKNGVDRSDRTGVGTRSLFGLQQRYDLREGFPAVSTKKLAWRAVVSELLWFIEGSGDERRLREILTGDSASEKGSIWTANAEADYWKPRARFPGDLGRVYGVQWRSWRTFNDLNNEADLQVGHYEYVDQLANLIEGLKADPTGRRHILSAWNPGELNDMALPPCHMFAQFYVQPYSQEERIQIMERDFPTTSPRTNGFYNKDKMLDIQGIAKGRLSCQMYQRSADMFLGVPFNIASYSLLTHMIAQVCDYEVGEFVHTIGDAHIYSNHIDAVKEQLTRCPAQHLPTLKIDTSIRDIDKFTMDSFELENYDPQPSIRAPMAV
jgi:thymidylate synthase